MDIISQVGIVCLSFFFIWLDRRTNSFRPCVRAYVMAYVMCLPMIKFLFFLFSFSITADHSSFSHIQKTFLTDHKPYKTTLNPLSTHLHHTLFHSGYDFGYFVKLLTAESLPTTEDGFFALLNIWFPTVYDIKFLMKASKLLKGGLQEVADDLGVCMIV